MKRGLDIELMFETIIVQKRKDFPSKLRVMSPPTSTNRFKLKRTDIPVLKIGTGNSAPQNKFFEAISQTTTSTGSLLRKAFKQSQVSKVFHVYY